MHPESHVTVFREETGIPLISSLEKNEEIETKRNDSHLTKAVVSLAESVRFELTVGYPITSFQDWLLKPLGQLSLWGKLYHY